MVWKKCHQTIPSAVISLCDGSYPQEGKVFLSIKMASGLLQTFQRAGWGFQELNPTHTHMLKEPEHLKA